MKACWGLWTQTWEASERSEGSGMEPTENMCPDQPRTLPMAEDEPVVQWLLQGDPAIRWQVLRDLVNA